MADEDDEIIKIGLECYYRYFSRYYGIGFFFLLLAALTLMTGSRLLNDYYLG